VWHALLSLMRHSVRLQYVTQAVSNDPLVVCALSYLPRITALGADCLWPRSFTSLMWQRGERIWDHRYLASQLLQGGESGQCHAQGAPLMLTDSATQAVIGQSPALLRPRPQPRLFTAYQHSLSTEQRVVLARWAAGDFHVGDEQLSAAESAVEAHSTEVAALAGSELCPHPHAFYTCYSANKRDTAVAVANEEKERAQVTGGGAGGLSDKEEEEEELSTE